MAEPIMTVETHRPFGAAWLASLPSQIGQDAATLLKSDWPLAAAVHRTSWRTVWDIFDEARADDRFTLTAGQWDAVEASLVALGGVDSREDLAAADEEEDA